MQPSVLWTHNLNLCWKLNEEYFKQMKPFKCNFESWRSAIVCQLNWTDKKEKPFILADARKAKTN